MDRCSLSREGLARARGQHRPQAGYDPVRGKRAKRAFAAAHARLSVGCPIAIPSYRPVGTRRCRVRSTRSPRRNRRSVSPAVVECPSGPRDRPMRRTNWADPAVHRLGPQGTRTTASETTRQFRLGERVLRTRQRLKVTGETTERQLGTPPLYAHSLRHILAALACRVRDHTRPAAGADPGLGPSPRG